MALAARSTREVLEYGRSLLEDPEHWCQDGWYILRAPVTGEPIKWCVLGAISPMYTVLAKGVYTDHARRVLESTFHKMYPSKDPSLIDTLTVWNDQRATHAEVLALYDAAIAAATAPSRAS